jgi:DNA-binding MarR family transcriptional regulator
MTRLVQALVRGGLVDRSANRTDNRVVMLHATSAGRQTLDIARANRLAALEELLARLRPGETILVERAVSTLEPLLRS